MNVHGIFSSFQKLYAKAGCFLDPYFLFPPLVLHIRLTNRCNLRCSFCFAHAKNDDASSVPLSPVEWRDLLSRMPFWSVLDITGGEPLAATGAIESLSAILSSGRRTSLITNGTLLDKRFVHLFLEKKLFYLMFSVDGLERSHDKIRGERTFAKLVDNLRELQNEKRKTGSPFPLLNAKINVTGGNSVDLVDLALFMNRELAVRRFTFNLLFENPARGSNPLADSIDASSLQRGNTISFGTEFAGILQLPEQIKAIKRLIRGVRVQIRPEIPLVDIARYVAHPSRFAPGRCELPWSSLTIYGNGTVTPCDLALRVGNVRDYGLDLRQLMKGLEYQRFLREFETRCRGIPGCQGCCMVPNHCSVAEANVD